VFNLLLSKIIPDLLVNIILLIIWISLSGGIHLDGLADSFDGLFGGKDKKKILEIMQDSSIGVYGVLALFLTLLLKYVLLIELPIQDKNMILMIAPTLSRLSMVLAVYYFPYARKEGFGKTYKLYLKRNHVILAFVWTVIISITLLFWQGIVLIIIGLLFSFVISKFITNKIDGLTGDNYGAINEIIEVLTLLISILLF
jgi:adenosylcobinamide-GDP ribazoletransferase